MVAVGGDNLKSKMEGLSLAERKTLSAKMKSKFTRHDKDCALALQLWGRNPEDRDLADRANKLIVLVRGDYENAMQVYDSIEGSQGITDELFQETYAPKILEMEQKIHKLETDLSKATAESRAAQRRVRDRDQERQRDGDEEGRGWKLQSTLQPNTKLNLDMNHPDIQRWERSWQSYFKISNLERASVDVQKAAFLACIEDSLIIRVEAQLELCPDINELWEVLQKEIRLKNPRLVARHKWMKTKQRSDESYTDFWQENKL